MDMVGKFVVMAEYGNKRDLCKVITRPMASRWDLDSYARVEVDEMATRRGQSGKRVFIMQIVEVLEVP